MKKFVKILSMLLILLGLYFSVRWFFEPKSNYEPLISGITFLIGLIGLFSSRHLNFSNQTKLKGNRNILIQSIDSTQSKSIANKLKLNGNGNIVEQKSNLPSDINEKS